MRVPNDTPGSTCGTSSPRLLSRSRRLIVFARRRIGVGQTITVSFRLGMEQLGIWDTEANLARFVVEPGTFGLCIGASLRATHELTFEVS